MYDLYLLFISCGSSGRTAEKTSLSFKSDQVKVKQEPGTEDEICSFSGAVKQEKTEDGRRSACMVRYQGSGRDLVKKVTSLILPSLSVLDYDIYPFFNFYDCCKPNNSFSNPTFSSKCEL